MTGALGGAQSDKGSTLKPLLVLGLDGASFEVIRPMIERGQLPNLGSWMKTGSHAPLRSTQPPVTFPAWSSFMTGLEPGIHGLFDFTQKMPGRYQVDFVNASHRDGVSLFAQASAAGGRVLVLGVPATFPPESVTGLLVPGFDAPISTGSSPEAASDPALYRVIEERAGPWMRPAAKESGSEGELSAKSLLERVDRKTAFAIEALRELRRQGAVDLMMVVFSESDTVGHHFWRDHDPNSPRHDPAASEERKGAIEAVYRKLDRACGELRREFGEEAACAVVSDHGMGGASRYVVQLNRHLANEGLLRRRRGLGGLSTRAAKRLRDTAIAMLPSHIAQALFRRARGAAARVESTARFGGFDWQRTLAFSEEANTQPGVWINLAGREAKGCVAADDYEAVRDRVIAALHAWRLPDGGPVVASASRRESVYRGPHVERAPDIVVELALDAQGYGLSLVPTRWDDVEAEAKRDSVRHLGRSEFAGGRGRGMNGTHRRDGIYIGVGDELEVGDAPKLQLAAMAPILLRAMGLAWQTDADAPRPTAFDDATRPYTDDESEIVAGRLRALGYLE